MNCFLPRNQSLKMELLVVVLLLFAQFSQAFIVIDKRSSHPKGVDLGGKIKLNCKSNEFFEKCSWSHDNGTCHFLWNGKNYIHQTMTCVGSTSLKFIGSYATHECEIELDNVSIKDHGNWTCLMTSSSKSGDPQSDDDAIMVSIISQPPMELDQNKTQSKNETKIASAESKASFDPIILLLVIIISSIMLIFIFIMSICYKKMKKQRYNVELEMNKNRSQ